MKSWKEAVLTPEATIHEAIRKIDHSGLQIALVVSAEGRLVGSVTDGDIRRGILKGIGIDAPVNLIMNKQPISAPHGTERTALLSMMKTKSVHQVPLVDAQGRLAGLETLDELLRPAQRGNIVVLMAGGLGVRLRPLTEDCPKPMLKIGGKPILETIIEGFIEHGFQQFYIAVNYKAELIERHFGDGSGRNVKIRYLRENERMGTAGALSLLPEQPALPVIVMNGDVLTKVNYDQLLGFHTEHGCQATMAVREYEMQVPFGVLKLNEHNIVGIEEKPVQRFFVNAGIYVLEPQALALVPKNERYDMPDLFAALLERNQATAAFPVREYWLDIGRTTDFEQANGEFRSKFFS